MTEIRKKNNSRTKKDKAPDINSDNGKSLQTTEKMADVAMVEKVIRRATRLQLARAGKLQSTDEGLSDSDILRIGEELGLDQSNVRQALLEVRSERLRPRKKTEKDLVTKIFGGRFVRSSRIIEKPAMEVQALLDSHLADRECLAAIRRNQGISIWVPATGLATKIQQGLNLGRRAYIISGAQEIALSVVSVSEEATLVTFTADIGNQRREKATGWSIGSLFMAGVPATVIFTLVFGIPVQFSLIGAMAGASTAAVSFTRMNMNSQKTRMKAALDGILERLQKGIPLEEPKASFQERFLK